MEDREQNVMALGLTLLGALTAVISLFLPLADAPGILPVESNTLVQTDIFAAIIIAGLALGAAQAAYDYYRSDWAGVRAIIFGGILAIGAILLTRSDGYFELTGPGGDFGLPTTIEAEPAIALYVTGAAGLAVAIGGYIMRQSRVELPTNTAQNSDATDRS